MGVGEAMTTTGHADALDDDASTLDPNVADSDAPEGLNSRVMASHLTKVPSSSISKQDPKAQDPDSMEVDPEKIPIVFFGRLEMRKGICTFVEALKQLDPELRNTLHIHFVGKVVQLHKSRMGAMNSDQYVQEELNPDACPIEYTLYPEFFSRDAIRFIRRLHQPIVCLTSHQENFPNSALEMGQLPTPLVVSDTGGFRETLKLVQRTSGVYWFKPADSETLALMLSKAIAAYPETVEVVGREALVQVNKDLFARKISFIENAFQRTPTHVIDKPRVTIGITCYNLGRYLVDCLVSVEAQTYSNLEVIVLDDASTEPETISYIEQAKSLFPNFKFIRADANLGLGNARNALIEMAAGNYFLPLDADNRLMPFSVEKYVEAACSSGASVIVSSMLHFGKADGVYNFKYTSVAQLLQSNEIGDACSLFKVEFLKRFRHPARKDGKTHDWCILAAAIATGEPIVHYPYPLYEYRMRHDSMIQDAVWSKERYYLRQYLAEIPPEKWTKRQIYMLMTALQQLQARELDINTSSDIRRELQETRKNLRQMRAKVKTLKSKLSLASDQLEDVNNSKFWKLRNAWFTLCTRLGLKTTQ